DAVGAFLAFLHLLVGDAQRFGQLLLAHCQHNAAHPHSLPTCWSVGLGAFFRGNGKRTAMADPLAKAIEQKSSRRWDIRHSDSTSNFWTRSMQHSADS